MRTVQSLTVPLALVEGGYRKAKGLLFGGHTEAIRGKGFDLIEEGRVVLTVSDFLGSFELDARSHLFRRLALDGSYEPASAAAVKRALPRVGDFIDVGANAGFFSVLFSGLSDAPRKVLAIEPTPGSFQILKRNLERNGVSDRVEAFEGAVGAECGRLELEFIPGREEYSSTHMAHPSVRQQERQIVDVALKTIDSLVEEKKLKPGFIKIDVEGNELSVLQGARMTLAQHRPHLLVEYMPNLLGATGASGQELLALLENAQYKVEWITDAELLAHPR